MSSFVPSTVAATVTTSSDVGNASSSAFITAALWCDVSGFTALCEALATRGAAGNETLSANLNKYFSMMSRIVASHGGDIIKYAGDAMLVIWPEHSGMALSERIGRAGQCALELQQNLHTASLDEGVCLSIKCGIGAGKVTLFILGDVKMGLEAVAVGGALQQAFAAEHAAEEGGEVLMSAQAASLVAGQFEAIADDYLVASGHAVGHDVPRRPVRIARDGRGVCLRPYRKYNVRSLLDSAAGDSPEANIAGRGGEAVAKLLPFICAPSIPWLAPSTSTDNGPGGQSHLLFPDPHAWMSELRHVSVVFANLGLPEAQSSGDDPALEASMRRAFSGLQRSVASYGGCVNKFLCDDKGPTAIAVFGLAQPPNTSGDALRSPPPSLSCPSRATLCALDLCAQLHADCGLLASVGVTSGAVFTGIVGGNSRREYTVLGDPVNLAARLMQRACTVGGGVITDAPTRASACPALSFTGLAPLRVKGKKEPVAVFRPYPNENGVDDGSNVSTMLPADGTVSGTAQSRQQCALDQQCVAVRQWSSLRDSGADVLTAASAPLAPPVRPRFALKGLFAHNSTSTLLPDGPARRRAASHASRQKHPPMEVLSPERLKSGSSRDAQQAPPRVLPLHAEAYAALAEGHRRLAQSARGDTASVSSVTLLTGPPGSGKTTLLRRLRDLAGGGANVLLAQPSVGPSPGGAWRGLCASALEALQSRWRLPDATFAAARVLTRWARASASPSSLPAEPSYAADGEAPARAVPPVDPDSLSPHTWNALLGTQLPEDPSAGANSDSFPAAVVSGLVTVLLHSLAAHTAKPILVLVDDAQCMGSGGDSDLRAGDSVLRGSGESEIRVLCDVVALSRTLPMQLVVACTARDELVGAAIAKALPSDAGAATPLSLERVTLDPLDASYTSKLFSAALSWTGKLSYDLACAVHSVSGGNPLAVTELAAGLLRSGRLGHEPRAVPSAARRASLPSPACGVSFGLCQSADPLAAELPGRAPELYGPPLISPALHEERDDRYLLEDSKGAQYCNSAAPRRAPATVSHRRVAEVLVHRPESRAGDSRASGAAPYSGYHPIRAALQTKEPTLQLLPIHATCGAGSGKPPSHPSLPLLPLATTVPALLNGPSAVYLLAEADALHPQLRVLLRVLAVAEEEAVACGTGDPLPVGLPLLARCVAAAAVVDSGDSKEPASADRPAGAHANEPSTAGALQSHLARLASLGWVVFPTPSTVALASPPASAVLCACVLAEQAKHVRRVVREALSPPPCAPADPPGLCGPTAPPTAPSFPQPARRGSLQLQRGFAVRDLCLPGCSALAAAGAAPDPVSTAEPGGVCRGQGRSLRGDMATEIPAGCGLAASRDDSDDDRWSG